MMYRCDLTFVSCASNSTYLLPHSTPPHTPPPSHYPCILSTMPHLSFTGLVLIFFQMFSMLWICAYFWHSYGPFGLCQQHGACILSFEIYFYTAHSCRAIKWWVPWPAI